MRMWMIDPKLMCRKHLLGEHGEIHKHKHNFEKKHNMNGRFEPVVQIEPISMKRRHDELAKEMEQRGYNHNSPFDQPDISYLGNLTTLRVDKAKSINDLASRCVECRRRIFVKTKP